MINIAICDDEKYYRQQIENLVTEYLNEHQIDHSIDIFSSGEAFYAKGLEMAKYDIIFLDISMGEINGIEIAYKIRTYKSDTYIIFVTGFINYALEGYKVDAIRYILKDTLKVSIVECLDTIFEKMEVKMNKYEFEFMEGKKKVYIDKIIYVESQKHKLKFYILGTSLKEHCMYNKLDNIELQLKEYRFLRIHKSYLVNMKYIEKISNYKALTTTGEELPIPKLRYQAVREAFALYKGEL
jgi:two-component system, LytTR family, response regulator LytT